MPGSAGAPSFASVNHRACSVSAAAPLKHPHHRGRAICGRPEPGPGPAASPWMTSLAGLDSSWPRQAREQLEIRAHYSGLRGPGARSRWPSFKEREEVAIPPDLDLHRPARTHPARCRRSWPGCKPGQPGPGGAHLRSDPGRPHRDLSLHVYTSMPPRRGAGRKP
jgi:hypothetical protein